MMLGLLLGAGAVGEPTPDRRQYQEAGRCMRIEANNRTVWAGIRFVGHEPADAGGLE